MAGAAPEPDQDLLIGGWLGEFGFFYILCLGLVGILTLIRIYDKKAGAAPAVVTDCPILMSDF